MKSTRTMVVFSALILCAFVSSALAQQDPYENYIKTSRDFRAVAQDPAMALKAWPSWTFMPWYYQWTIGFTDASGEWCRNIGINGAFTDHGHPDNLLWINKFQLRFYNDHTAGKGNLHLWDGGKQKGHEGEMFGTGVRVKPMNAAMLTRLKEIMTTNIGHLKDSPYRAAYALDDEVSWGHFVKAVMWQATDDAAAYPAWLKEVYGPNAPQRDKWISYSDILPMLKTWSVADFDASPLMDQWSFNDSVFNNMVGDLVEHSNKVDPATPCGWVGGQSPNAFGGFDYAKIMRKVQFIESYNLGGSQSIVRSFNPHNALPSVTTFFIGKGSAAADGIWQTWYYLAQGNKGFIAWVDNWFDPQADEKAGMKATPKPWIIETSPNWKEAGQKIGPLLSGSEWVDDGVMLYYSHASIQLGWILDAQSHGSTWTNRDGDARLGSPALGRKAWMNMLRDEGIQFTWLNYVDLIQNGIPARCKVLILPSTLCLSDAEAKRIKEFCRNGGVVIADYMPGLWDQHGKGRPGGELDEMFGLKHDPKMTVKDVFGGTFWSETNQDANYGYKRVVELLTNKNDSIKAVGGFDKAVRAMGVDHINAFGKGKAVLMNLSPQWYLAFREAGVKEAAAREVFMKHVKTAVQPWVRIKDAGEKTFGYEITYWSKGGRTIAFLISNPEISGNELGGGNSVGLKTDEVKVTLKFAKAIKGVVNERTREKLPDGTEFPVTWKMNEAVVLSFGQ